MSKSILGAVILALFLTGLSLADENTGMDNKAFAECVAVELYTLSPKFVNKDRQPEDTSKIPDGWTFAGGGGGGGHPTMIICR